MTQLVPQASEERGAPTGEARPPDAFGRVRARTVLLLVVAAGASVEVLRRTLVPGMPEGWSDLASSLAFQVISGGLLVAYLRHGGVRVGRLVGRAPRGWRPWAPAAVVAPLLMLSLGSAALLFSLVAALAPGFAAGLHGVGDDAAGATGTAAVLLQALAGVLAAGMEELLFRGVLLTRWERRWGAGRAAVASSLAFALLHMDPVGAFVFGLAMCLLYLRTRSLWVPILCHALNNAVIALSDLGDPSGSVAGPSAADLAPDWAAAAIAFAVALPALAWFFYACWPRKGWRLPYDDPAEDGSRYS